MRKNLDRHTSRIPDHRRGCADDEEQLGKGGEGHSSSEANESHDTTNHRNGDHHRFTKTSSLYQRGGSKVREHRQRRGKVTKRKGRKRASGEGADGSRNEREAAEGGEKNTRARTTKEGIKKKYI